MDVNYWDRFLKTGSVDDYLQYRQCICQSGKEIINEQLNDYRERNSSEGNKN